MLGLTTENMPVTQPKVALKTALKLDALYLWHRPLDMYYQQAPDHRELPVRMYG